MKSSNIKDDSEITLELSPLNNKSIINEKRVKRILNPYFITGFSDAEGCFAIGLTKDSKRKTGWIISLEFVILLHGKDRALLEAIQCFFSGVGSIVKGGGGNGIAYKVRSINDLTIVMDHFDEYPLITQKYSDYKLFKQAFEIVSQKEHLNISGLEKIISLKASMNKGLSVRLKEAFPNIIPVQRPFIKLPLNLSPYWLAGFVTGDGCFFINIFK